MFPLLLNLLFRFKTACFNVDIEIFYPSLAITTIWAILNNCNYHYPFNATLFHSNNFETVEPLVLASLNLLIFENKDHLRKRFEALFETIWKHFSHPQTVLNHHDIIWKWCKDLRKWTMWIKCKQYLWIQNKTQIQIDIF